MKETLLGRYLKKAERISLSSLTCWFVFHDSNDANNRAAWRKNIISDAKRKVLSFY